MNILVNIENLSKPVTMVPIVRRAQQYVATMRELGKPVEKVALTATQYDTILHSINAARDERNKASGLRLGDIAVTRGAA